MLDLHKGNCCQILISVGNGMIGILDHYTFFRCGYVLQPEVMRGKDYSPFSKQCLRNIDPLTLTITVSNIDTFTNHYKQYGVRLCVFML